MKFNEEIIINENRLTKQYVESLTKDQRIKLIELIFKYFRENGFQYPDDEGKLIKEYNKLCDVEINEKEIFNNDKTGTFICKYFCKSFYNATGPGKKSMVELFNNNEVLKSVIRNKLGIGPIDENNIEAFQISFRQIIQGFRSSRNVPMIDIFKPKIARYIYEKYSNKNDTVYDFSAGFGGRLLGAMASGRKYVGVDPLTIPELKTMVRYFNFSNYLLIAGGSEDICLEKNSIDLAFSSPPYFNQEIYSNDESQAYNKGEDYFYNVYWEKTLENIHYMLKPEKIFALNIKDVPKLVEMAKEKFELIDEIYLIAVKNHLNKKTKMESIYIFKK
jgi:DNA modification methylase